MGRDYTDIYWPITLNHSENYRSRKIHRKELLVRRKWWIYTGRQVRQETGLTLSPDNFGETNLSINFEASPPPPLGQPLCIYMLSALEERGIWHERPFRGWGIWTLPGWDREFESEVSSLSSKIHVDLPLLYQNPFNMRGNWNVMRRDSSLRVEERVGNSRLYNGTCNCKANL